MASDRIRRPKINHWYTEEETGKDYRVLSVFEVGTTISMIIRRRDNGSQGSRDWDGRDLEVPEEQVQKYLDSGRFRKEF